MGLSKSTRFEVFARDAFTCQYCGRRPPEVVLECDHIHPQSKGGKDDLLNLITSCADCNRGKSAKVVSEVAPRPDADLAYLKTQQEIVEVQRFLDAKMKQDELTDNLFGLLRGLWSKHLGYGSSPSNETLSQWHRKYGAEEIGEAIQAASFAYQRGQFSGYRKSEKILKYVAAILRNRNEDPERWGVNVAKDEENFKVVI